MNYISVKVSPVYLGNGRTVLNIDAQHNGEEYHTQHEFSPDELTSDFDYIFEAMKHNLRKLIVENQDHVVGCLCNYCCNQTFK